jgi:hypothetical protein
MDAALQRETFTRQSQQAALAAAIERDVKERTSGRVADLEVAVDAAGVHLRGRCATFYCKQLAQHAAMAVTAGEAQLFNEIEVW